MRLTPSPANQAALLGLDVNGIMWTDATVNPGLSGCAKVSPACTNCYAEGMAARIRRMGGNEPNPAGPAVRYAQGLTDDGRWTGRVVVMPDQIAPAFRKIPWTTGKVRRVFVTSMSDLFHEDVPFAFIDRVFVEMDNLPQVFQVLTKRAERMAEYAADCARRGLSWPANVWAGVTVEDQKRADERIPFLLRVPAAVRFLSIEPMLGAIDLGFDVLAPGNVWRECLCREIDIADVPCFVCGSHGIHQVIVGSESDGNRPGARETREEWITSIVDQCDAAGVACFVKQAAINGRLCSLPLVDGVVRAGFPS